MHADDVEAIFITAIALFKASHINMLLTKLQASNNSRSSSKSNLRQS